MPPLRPLLLALDLDGTLVEPRRPVRPTVIEAVHRAQAAGVRVTIVTGRMYVGAKPFADVLDKTQITMAATNSAHMLQEGNDFTAARAKAADSWETTYSGNSVSLEQEMMKEGDINRSYTLNANIKRAFHQMLMLSVK